MKSSLRNNANRKPLRDRALLLGALLYILALPAHAQLTKFTGTLNAVQIGLLSVSLTIFTITIMVAGFQVAWRHLKITEVSHILWGGCLTGGAAGLAALLVGG